MIGCGALGLTSAILAQRAGAKVTIYARDLLPDTRSSRATGTWTPDSRIALADKVAPDFPALWEEMARISFHTYRSYLGLPGTPVEWTDRYYLSDDLPPRRAPAPDAAPARSTSRTITTASAISRRARQEVARRRRRSRVKYVRRFSSMTFNIADYGHTLMTDFLIAGGKIERREFHAPGELAAAEGEGGDQLPRLCGAGPLEGRQHRPGARPDRLADPAAGGELRRHLRRRQRACSRRDGIVLQMLEGGDMRGYGDDHETAGPGRGRTAVDRVAALYAKFKA